MLALEPLHGWAISLRLRSISGDVLQVSEGSLYPALHKLEQEGWIRAEWKQTENNRRAKFYSLTRLGRKQLESEAANWQRLSSAISHVVQLSEAELCDPQPAPDAGTDRVRSDHDCARDRDDRDAFQHARCADLQAVPRPASERRGHSGEHFKRQ